MKWDPAPKAFGIQPNSLWELSKTCLLVLGLNLATLKAELCEISALLPPTLTFLSITTRWQPVVLHTWQGSLPKLLDKLSSTKRHRDWTSGYDLFAWEPRSQNIKRWKDVFHLHSWVELECSRQEQRSRQTDGLVCRKWNVVSYTVYKDSLDAFIVWGDSSLSRWVLKK